MGTKEKKPKIHSFAKRLTWWIAITQLIVMGLAGYYIYNLAKGIVMMEESDLYKSYLNNTSMHVGRILAEVSTGTANHVSEIEDNLDHPDRLTTIM